MNDGLLSQEEINALLNTDSTEQTAAPTSDNNSLLTTQEKDALGEIGNISMGSAATTLSILLSNKVNITTPTVDVTKMEEIQNEYPLPYLVIVVDYTKGLKGSNIFAIKEHDALIIADLMMGGDGSNPPTELTELYMSAVSEAMNQMMGATATSMSTMFKDTFDIAPPRVSLVDFSQNGMNDLSAKVQDPVVKVSFRMEVGDLIDSDIMQILTLDVAKNLVEKLYKPSEPPVQASAPAKAVPQPRAAASVAPQTQVLAQQPMYTPPPMVSSHMGANVPVQQVQFAPLTQQGMPAMDGNLGLLLDVPLQITVELGRTRKLIRDILDLGPGSVVELDKLAGEPVDIFANTKLIAKGEVVVIDENFGVRITEIVSPLERVNTLQ